MLGTSVGSFLARPNLNYALSIDGVGLCQFRGTPTPPIARSLAFGIHVRV